MILLICGILKKKDANELIYKTDSRMALRHWLLTFDLELCQVFSEIPRSLLLLLLKLSALSSEVFAACSVRMAGHAQKQVACA